MHILKRSQQHRPRLVLLSPPVEFLDPPSPQPQPSRTDPNGAATETIMADPAESPVEVLDSPTTQPSGSSVMSQGDGAISLAVVVISLQIFGFLECRVVSSRKVLV